LGNERCGSRSEEAANESSPRGPTSPPSILKASWNLKKLGVGKAEKLLDFLEMVKYHHGGIQRVSLRGGDVGRFPGAPVQKGELAC
jgi:hypothetical protein